MIAMIQFAILAITTMFAVAAALSLNWLFLRATFVLMQPAAARKSLVRSELVRGTAQLARAFQTPR